MGSVEMICITVEICEGTITHRVQITAPCIEHALKIAGEGRPGRQVRVLFPIDPQTFFAPENNVRKEVA